jgi:hypothetical protein
MTRHIYSEPETTTLNDISRRKTIKSDTNKTKKILSQLSKSDKVYVDDNEDNGEQCYFNYFSVNETGFLFRDISHRKVSSLFSMYNTPQPLRLLITQILYKFIKLNESNITEEKKIVLCELMKSLEVADIVNLNMGYTTILDKKQEHYKSVISELDKGKALTILSQKSPTDKGYSNKMNTSEHGYMISETNIENNTLISLDIDTKVIFVNRNNDIQYNDIHDTDTKDDTEIHKKWLCISDDPFFFVRDNKKFEIYGNKTESSNKIISVFDKKGNTLIQADADYKSLLFSNTISTKINESEYDMSTYEYDFNILQSPEKLDQKIYLNIVAMENATKTNMRSFFLYNIPTELVIAHIFDICYRGLYSKEIEVMRPPMLLSGVYKENTSTTTT